MKAADLYVTSKAVVDHISAKGLNEAVPFTEFEHMSKGRAAGTGKEVLTKAIHFLMMRGLLEERGRTCYQLTPKGRSACSEGKVLRTLIP